MHTAVVSSWGSPPCWGCAAPSAGTLAGLWPGCGSASPPVVSARPSTDWLARSAAAVGGEPCWEGYRARGQPPWKGPASLEGTSLLGRDPASLGGASLPGKDLPPGRDLPESLHLLVRPAGASSHALPRLGAGSWVQRAWQAVTSRATAGLFLRRCGGAPGTGVPASSGPGGLGPCLCCCHLQFCPGSP